ncbi:MAG: 1-(5-phosphoribosyl)-5-[(5-phosphoribosylamino)methylideneamino]imidazole-4-carboxamide isomerase [Methanoregulaceae archaeon]|nr:1-(5-phosphoribosyl)-5-[(5-phosphoribosylamino)methylideneamino]imidazole-4-carboxamide isomerase [Methanoregulaceae archaeon]
MKIYPAVDILNGRCVQLVQGREETAAQFGAPLECAYRWLREGADALHVINLDGAFGNAGGNAMVIQDLVSSTDVFVQLGGGIRSVEDAALWIDAGVDRVILGTLAARSPETLRVLSERFGSERIMASVDAVGGRVAIEGWRKTVGDYLNLARRYESMGAGSLLYTNVDVEGLQRGIDPGPVGKLIREVSLPVTVAGGISTVDDIIRLRDIGADGAVLGSALYAGKIMLRDAIEASE